MHELYNQHLCNVTYHHHTISALFIPGGWGMCMHTHTHTHTHGKRSPLDHNFRKTIATSQGRHAIHKWEFRRVLHAAKQGQTRKTTIPYISQSLTCGPKEPVHSSCWRWVAPSRQGDWPECHQVHAHCHLCTPQTVVHRIPVPKKYHKQWDDGKIYMVNRYYLSITFISIPPECK